METETVLGRILAIDFGNARVGLALSDPMGMIAKPFEVLQVAQMPKTIERIAEIVKEQEVTRIVIGLPLNMDGSEGFMVAQTRAFAADLAAATDLTPVEWDERLTSAQAHATLAAQGQSRQKRKKKIDAVAAQILLESYLSSISGS